MKRESGSLYADEKYRATSAGAEPRRTGCDIECKPFLEKIIGRAAPHGV